MTIQLRLAAIQKELEAAASGYEESRQLLQVAVTKLALARERLIYAREMASQMMTGTDWNKWQQAHPSIKYAGMSLAKALTDALVERAWDAAFDFLEGKVKHFRPHASLESLVQTLEEGGFDFRTPTPTREVNAALLNLSGVVKEGSLYRSEDADKKLELVRSYKMLEHQKQGRKAFE